jgi:hypothetical protein
MSRRPYHGGWGASGRSAVHLSLLLDYGYMVSYALAGFAVRDMARRRGWVWMAASGAIVPYCALAASAFDASETSRCF